MGTAPEQVGRGTHAIRGPNWLRLIGYLLSACGVNVAIWAPGYQGNVGWLVLAVSLIAAGALVIIFANLQGRRARMQLDRAPIDRLLESGVIWTATPDAEDQYSAEASGTRWELHVDVSNQGTRYIVGAHGRAVGEIPYLPTGWVLGDGREK
jgi:hypothetical protein